MMPGLDTCRHSQLTTTIGRHIGGKTLFFQVTTAIRRSRFVSTYSVFRVKILDRACLCEFRIRESQTACARPTNAPGLCARRQGRPASIEDSRTSVRWKRVLSPADKGPGRLIRRFRRPFVQRVVVGRLARHIM